MQKILLHHTAAGDYPYPLVNQGPDRSVVGAANQIYKLYWEHRT
jgi:hypothetical protein